MPFNGDNFIYFKDLDESYKNISRSTYIHVTQMDQKYKVFKTKYASASVKKESLGGANSPPYSSSASPVLEGLLMFSESFANCHINATSMPHPNFRLL